MTWWQTLSPQRCAFSVSLSLVCLLFLFFSFSLVEVCVINGVCRRQYQIGRASRCRGVEKQSLQLSSPLMTENLKITCFNQKNIEPTTKGNERQLPREIANKLVCYSSRFHLQKRDKPRHRFQMRNHKHLPLRSYLCVYPRGSTDNC